LFPIFQVIAQDFIKGELREKIEKFPKKLFFIFRQDFFLTIKRLPEILPLSTKKSFCQNLSGRQYFAQLKEKSLKK